MSRSDTTPPTDPAVALARHVRHLVWLSRAPDVHPDAARCYLEGYAADLARLARLVLYPVQPTLFTGDVPDGHAQ